MYFIFPPHLTNASALPGETENPEIVSFYLNAACFSPKKRNTVKNITWSKLNHPSLLKRSTGCTSWQGLEREPSCCLLPTCCVLAESVTVSDAVWKMGVVLRQAWIKSQCTVLVGYLTISTNVRRYQTHHMWPFFFQEDSAQVHCACNTVQLSAKCDFRVSTFWQVVQKRKSFEVA